MKTLEIENGQLAYEDEGAGETIILMHSAGTSSRQWRRLVPRLATRFRVLTVDLRGHGESSPWGAGETPKLTAEAAAIHQLATLAGGRAHLAGHGYGASVALRAGLDRPKLYTAVTAIEPVSFHVLRKGMDSDRSIYLGIAQLALDLANASVSGSARDGARKFVSYFSGPETWDDISFDARRNMCDRLISIAYSVFATAQDRAILDDFADYRLPVRLITGDRTVQPVRRVAERLRSYLPGAKQDWLIGAGHMAATSSHADAVAELIASHHGTYLPLFERADRYAA